MTWLIVIIVVAVIGGMIGFLGSNDGERGEGFLKGLFGGAFGCGTVVFYVATSILSFYLLFSVAEWFFD